MRTDAASRTEPEADAGDRLERLARDGWAIPGLALASRYRQRRLAALRGQLGAQELAWDRREVPPIALADLRGRVSNLEQLERAEAVVALELLARIRRAERAGWPARRWMMA